MSESPVPSSWNLLDDFRRRLAKIREATPPPPDPRPGGPERLLLAEDYFSLMLFGLFNPVLDSMRGLCAASHLDRVQKEVCGRAVSPGSFPEAQAVFDPELLRGVFLDLSGEIQSSWGDPRLAHPDDRLKSGRATRSASSGSRWTERFCCWPPICHRQASRQAGDGIAPLLHDGIRRFG